MSVLQILFRIRCKKKQKYKDTKRQKSKRQKRKKTKKLDYLILATRLTGTQADGQTCKKLEKASNTFFRNFFYLKFFFVIFFSNQILQSSKKWNPSWIHPLLSMKAFFPKNTFSFFERRKLQFFSVQYFGPILSSHSIPIFPYFIGC